MSAIQISDARTKLEYVLKDISDISTGQFLYMCQTVSDFIYDALIKVDPEKYIKSTTINITGGTNSYSLPADFKNLNVLGTGLYAPDSDGYATDQRWTLTGYGSKVEGYYLDNTKLILTPDDYPNSDTAILRYIPTAPVFTDLSDYFTQDGTSTGQVIIDSSYMHYLVNALQTQYMIIDEDPGAESLSDFRFTRSLDQLLKNVKRTSATVMMPDISSIF